MGRPLFAGTTLAKLTAVARLYVDASLLISWLNVNISAKATIWSVYPRIAVDHGMSTVTMKCAMNRSPDIYVAAY